MRIGDVVLKNNIISAPMAGFTDKAYRILAKEAGCGLVFTEMISDKALIYNNQRTWKLLDLTGEEKPIAVQIFGADPGEMAEAARMVEEHGAAIIDINMGCPTPKIVKNGEGAALMREPSRASAIVREVVGAVRVPVTVKMRKGWDDASVNAVELARMVVDAGASVLTVHGRTRMQFYSGQADWDIIRRVVQSVEVPVIGNGDLREPEDAVRMLDETGCSGVMVGRAALGNPWLFERFEAYLGRGERLSPPTAQERVTTALRHLRMAVEFKGEWTGVREMRKHLAWYLRGLKGAARVRQRINRMETLPQVEEVLVSLLGE
ncbi:TIM barrel oxidoreductase NifR3 [Clostridiales bacterium PH28_bin88]|nr:TIM barrel oxidoreductase NifR3 [Clostridiales bacterium PH28_bin88]